MRILVIFSESLFSSCPERAYWMDENSSTLMKENIEYFYVEVEVKVLYENIKKQCANFIYIILFCSFNKISAEEVKIRNTGFS